MTEPGLDNEGKSLPAASILHSEGPSQEGAKALAVEISLARCALTDRTFSVDNGLRQIVSNEEKPEQAPDQIRLPKNRSTGNLLAGLKVVSEDGKPRVNFDTGSAVMSPNFSGQEHGLGISGLRRIRQQPPSRAPSQPSSPTASYALPPRSSSMTLGMSSSQGLTRNVPASPSLNFTEDLSRFPSESLHSFSFAHQSEDALHNRTSVLKRAIEFMRDRLGFGVNHPGVMTAQAKISGDTEIQSMVDLLVRANVIGDDGHDKHTSRQLHGPLTGPADVEGNVFEEAFVPRPQSPEQLKKPSSEWLPREFGDVDLSRLRPNQAKAPLDIKSSAQESPESESPISGSSIAQNRHLGSDRSGLKRTYTDLSLLTLQTKLVEALARPYKASDHIHDSLLLSPMPATSHGNGINTGLNTPSHVHGHNNRWVPAAQAVFTTETSSPWTILAANDLACLVFGVTKAEVKKLSMLEVVREDRRAWLEAKLQAPGSIADAKARQARSQSARSSPKSSTLFTMGGGVTAQLLSKPSWRQQKAQTNEIKKKTEKVGPNHPANLSRGVLLCGDIVPIQKRNGHTGAASLWVKEKRAGLIWVLEEIAEDIATLTLDEGLYVIHASGATNVIWGQTQIPDNTNIRHLIPQIPIKIGSSIRAKTGFEKDNTVQYFATMSDDDVRIPVSTTMEPDGKSLRVSSFPHIAGIMVLSASTLRVVSSNSVFSAALFGQADLEGQKITQLIPQFEKTLEVLTEEDHVHLVDGIVVPEHSFRRARALLALREGNADAAAIFLHPQGLIARHRDGSDINIDVQMRVVRSERKSFNDSVIEEKSEYSDTSSQTSNLPDPSEIVFALWITYSRRLHSAFQPDGAGTPNLSQPDTSHQPSPGQADPSISPQLIEQEESKPNIPPLSTLTQQIQEAASQPISENAREPVKAEPMSTTKRRAKSKKKITDFMVLEEMGQGAYGQVKLARYSQQNKKVVLKYVTKLRILSDTWTKDRRLGIVPLEIHVLDYLRKEELRHPNIVEMTDFFEDNINYYIEMVPHGLPGMDLFDYIEMRSTMDEAECRNIFLQVVHALHHLHTKALVVHRDIKDENIVLDGEGNVKLIDFGSAAYIKNGPFDVFVGTIGMSLPSVHHPSPGYSANSISDYAAPEVLQGKSYRGKEQDIWALGILLYTLVYKENPFYSIDEILDHELRIPWIMSEPSIDLIKAMLNRDVDQRLTITQVKEHRWCVEDVDG